MMREVDELRRQFKPLSDTKIPEQTRSKITTMIDQYEPHVPKKANPAEILRTSGAMFAVVAVFCFVVFHVKKPNESVRTEGAGFTASVVQSHMQGLAPYAVLLVTSLIVMVIVWAARKGLSVITYRYQGDWLSGSGIGVRAYDSVRLQTYISILFSWLMFAIFVAPSSTSPWVGVVAFLVFCALCGSVRYLLFAVFSIFAITIPAWWVATLPNGDIVQWYPMVILNIAFFILTPGMVLIPVRNALIRRWNKSEGGVKA